MSERMTDDTIGALWAQGGAQELAEVWDEATRARASEVALLVDVERLEAELARLTPSGQVAEDARVVETAFQALPPTVHLEADARAALSRLAAKAQGYEAAVAANEAMREPMQRLRDAMAMPAQSERAVIDAILIQREREMQARGALLKEKQEQEDVIKALSDALEKALERYSRREQGSDEYRTARAALRRAGRLP